MPREKSGKDKMADWWLQHIGEAVDTRTLAEVSGILSHTRRVRELRLDHGWPIQSHRDDPTLKPNQYRLTGLPPAEPPPRFTRRVPANLHAQVLERNGSVCKLCGRTPEDRHPNGRRVVMHVDHIRHGDEGEPHLENLRTLCDECNEGASDTLTKPPDSLLWLKGRVRQASRSNQRALYDYLGRIFEGETT